MNILNFKVVNQQVSCTKRSVVADAQANWVKMSFEFSEEWLPLDKTVQITQISTSEVKSEHPCCCGAGGKHARNRTYNMHLGVNGTTCYLPQEIESGEIEVSVFGYDTQEAARATTVPCKVFIRRSGFVSDGGTPIPPTKDLYEQIIDELDEKAKNIQNGADGKDGRNGADGYSPSAKVEKTDLGAVITITDKSGTTSAEISNGKNGINGSDGKNGVDGKDGTNGVDGKNGIDGISPKATVTQTDAGAVITITDASGTTSANILNGRNGADGKDGLNGTNGKDGTAGISPTVSVTKTDTGATISITDVNGTTTADLMNGVIGKDGTNGKDGKDGVSPTAKVTQTETGATVTVTDASGTTTAVLTNGKDGAKGEKGDTGDTGADGKNGENGKDGGTPAISVYTDTATTYQLKITNADGTEIITPNLMGKSGGSTPAPAEKSVMYDSSNYAKYADSIYVYNGYKASQNIDAVESLQEAITAGEKLVNADHAIDINQNEFGWANLALIINTDTITVSSSEMMLTTANVNGSATEKVYFIPTSLVTATTASAKADAIAAMLNAGTLDSSIIVVDNTLIHTGGNPLTVAVKLDNVASGDYYMALSAHSDNSKPIYYSIWIQE